MNEWLRLRNAAWLALVTHTIAAIAMVGVLRHGLATNPDWSAREVFIVEHRALWTSAWLCWNAAALSILYFFVCFSRTRPDNAGLRFAVMLATAGVACDLMAESIAMGVMPAVSGGEVFNVLGRAVEMMSGYVANGLYALATLFVVWLTRHDYRPPVWRTGLCVCGAAIALSIAVLRNSVAGMVWSNVVLLPCIVLWQLGVAITAGKRARVLP